MRYFSIEECSLQLLTSEWYTHLPFDRHTHIIEHKVEEKSLAHFLFSTFLFWYDVSKMSEKSYE